MGCTGTHTDSKTAAVCPPPAHTDQSRWRGMRAEPRLRLGLWEPLACGSRSALSVGSRHAACRGPGSGLTARPQAAPRLLSVFTASCWGAVFRSPRDRARREVRLSGGSWLGAEPPVGRRSVRLESPCFGAPTHSPRLRDCPGRAWRWPLTQPFPLRPTAFPHTGATWCLRPGRGCSPGDLS